jgi:uncharacterized protein (DUF1697 family)
MTSYIALLRGINVGGNKQIAMSDLRDRFTKAGFEDVRTLLQSGNVVFRSKTRPVLPAIPDVDVFVRSAKEWNAIIERNPFTKEAKSDPGLLIMMVLKDAPRSLTDLRAAISGREVVEAVGKQLYVFYPDGQGRSKFSHAVIEKRLGTRATGRSWNTVLKIQAAL